MSQNPTHPVQMAGLAQKMAKMLFLDCPPNYHCGGPAYAALTSMDAILGLMGIGIAMIQRSGGNTEAYQKFVRESAITGDGIFSTFIQHKSQILASALYAILWDVRTQKLRECQEVAENAILSAIQLYLTKTGTNPQTFVEKILKGNHDELEQLEVSLRHHEKQDTPAEEGAPDEEPQPEEEAEEETEEDAEDKED